MAINTDYTRNSLSIMRMVFNRIQFLNREDTPTQDTVKDFIWEVMHELEPCFKVGVDNPSLIGHEANYTINMQSIIADVVSIYILMYQVTINGQGVAGQAATGIKFLKRAKAGSAEVEWGQLSTKDSAMLSVGAENLMNLYKKSAARKARDLGCTLDICDDCLGDSMGIMPMVVLTDCGCH